MKNLLMCRVCLLEDNRSKSIVGTHLQEIYESLVLMPFETTDCKPILVCYICRSRLQNCYELRKSCIESEELFTQMMSCNEYEQVKLRVQASKNKKRLTIHNTVEWILGMDSDNVGEEALNCEVKDEPNGEDIDEDALEEKSVLDNIQSADDFLITVKEEQIGYRTSDVTLKEPTQVLQRSSEDSTSHNLNEHEFVQDTFQKLHEVTGANITDNNRDILISVPSSERVYDTFQQCFSSKCELDTHVRLCSDAGKEDLSLENSTITHTYTGEKPYSCYKCKEKFSQKYYLIKHLRSHSDWKPYQCNKCKEQFLQKYHLTHHLRIHTDMMPYQCDMCKERFSSKYILIKHIGIHTGQKLHPCNSCKKQYSRKCDLEKHMRIHTGEIHQCNVCKVQFPHKKNLISHLRKHHGVKPYQCNSCNKQFSQNSHLKKHMLIHTGEIYQCNLCKVQFSHKKTWISHVRIGHGVKPYQCKSCKKHFSRKCDLIRHNCSHW